MARSLFLDEEGSPEPHTLIQLNALDAFIAFRGMREIFEGYGLGPLCARRMNVRSATEDEVYRFGERSTGRLYWGWKLHPETGVTVKAVFEIGNHAAAVSFWQDSRRWVAFVDPTTSRLHPAVRTTSDLWQIADYGRITKTEALAAVDALAQGYLMHGRSFAGRRAS
ncbi:MAG: hypothetical protein WCV84_05770 [Patescibacteria group bacterium]